MGVRRSAASDRATFSCFFKRISFVYCRLLIALCADTSVALYFGWQSTVALAQTGTPDSMVPFAGFAFWPPLSFSTWLVGHGHSG
jgi:hypothetical protein